MTVLQCKRACLCLLGLGALLLLPTLLTAAPSTPSVHEVFAKDEIRRSMDYVSVLRPLYFLGLAFEILLLLGVWRSGLARRLHDRLDGASTRRRILALVASLAGIMLTLRLCRLPLSFLRGYVVSRRFGFATQTAVGWFGDWGLSLAVGLPLQLIVFGLLYGMMARWPRRWWLPASLANVVYLLLVFWLAPVLIAPLFNDFRPCDDPALVSGARGLAEKAGIPVDEILIMDASRRSTKVNAYYSGLGNTRRVVLYDTLMKKHDRGEILSILAHEFGHWHHGHIRRGLAMGMIGAALLSFILSRIFLWLCPRLGLDGPGDPATFPLLLLLLLVFGLATRPMECAISRHMERQADRFALDLSEDPESFVAVERKLTLANRGDPNPPRWLVWFFGTHPPVLERIGAALSWCDEHGRPRPPLRKPAS